jgi:predicted ATPase
MLGGRGGTPYWPWAQIIRAVAEGRDEESLRSFAASGAAEIALLVPELAMRLRVPTGRLRPIESDAGRFYVFEAVTSFLRAASQPQPIVLVIDDLHDADRPSLLLLRYLIGDVRRSRMQVLTTYREAVPEPDAEAEDLLAALAREGKVLGLQGLDRDEVGRLVEQVSGSMPLQDRVTEIYEATDGNPLFVGEVTRLMPPTIG